MSFLDDLCMPGDLELFMDGHFNPDRSVLCISVNNRTIKSKYITVIRTSISFEEFTSKRSARPDVSFFKSDT